MKLLDLYHRLPYGGRCLAASLNGFYLRWSRYGAVTSRLVGEAVERERWDGRRWQQFHQAALTALLQRAVARVPYYRRYWRRRPRRDWIDLCNWPILTKETVRRDPRAFLADDCRPWQMHSVHTSGSTGTPLSLWRSRSATMRWYALFEARARAWNAVSRHDPWAILGGQLVAPIERRRAPFWVWNAGLKQLYLSSYHLAPANAAAYLEAMVRHRIRYLLGYPSAMAALAQLAEEQQLAAPRLAVALTNAEPLYPRQRRAIESAFGCPVRETYGAAEVACSASECPHGNLHLWPEVGHLEVVTAGRDEPLPPGETGRLIVTGLLNADMPLIRYEIGDRGSLAPVAAECACGRRLPILAAVEGRDDDVVVTPDGRRVGRLDPVFKADLPIREAQIVQESRTRVTLRLVPAPGYGPEVAAELEGAMRHRLGPEMEIAVEEMEQLPRGAGGKLRAVVSRISEEGPDR